MQCLSVLGRFYFRPDIIEQIWLGVSREGKLQVEEVYDLFFRTPHTSKEEELKDVNLLLLSPHGLRNPADGALCVNAEQFPGSTQGSGRYDAVYQPNSCAYSATDRTFSIELVGTPVWRFESAFDPLFGTVLTPTPRIPQQIVENQQVVDLMQEIGTVFELPLGNLAPKARYAMRLVVRPQTLNIRNKPINIPDLHFPKNAYVTRRA